MVGILHSFRITPGLFQRRESALMADLMKVGFREDELNEALNSAISEGKIVRIREMRHRGSTDHWLTLTEKSTWEYQQEFQVDHQAEN